MVKNTFIVTAGGIGKRMGADIPKQFIEICGKPIIIHTIERLLTYDIEAQLIVTLPISHVDFFKDLLIQFLPNQSVTLVVGGEERFHSIKNALEEAKGEFIWIHDAVRPFVSLKVLNSLGEAVQSKKAVIPVIEVKESLRQVLKHESKAVKRSEFRIVQTPQVFERNLIEKAYLQEYSNEFTDDASVVESDDVEIYLVEGNEENIKLTNPLDLKLADLLI
jgi:2-C-methyl-D-erythritol 4-phosphate cytidylyltransferase